MSKFARSILPADAGERVVALLQGNLVDLIDLALQLKQVHWNVVGPLFLPLHEKLDDIIDSARGASDDVAERIVAIGHAAEGRASSVAEGSRLPVLSGGFADVPTSATATADRLHATTTALRESIAELGDLDPISEDLLIGITADLEKHLWMIQAMEVG